MYDIAIRSRVRLSGMIQQVRDRDFHGPVGFRISVIIHKIRTMNPWPLFWSEGSGHERKLPGSQQDNQKKKPEWLRNAVAIWLQVQYWLCLRYCPAITNLVNCVPSQES